jgi:hypothetical protein
MGRQFRAYIEARDNLGVIGACLVVTTEAEKAMLAARTAYEAYPGSLSL